SLHYFLSARPRLLSPSYVPMHEDILHLRARTIRITETTFHLDGIDMLVVDAGEVGDVESGRRKWIHTFNDVTNIIFAVSLSGYDMTLVEDRFQNQMQDSLSIWDSFCNSKWSDPTSIILCLTKNDLFEKKVLTSHKTCSQDVLTTYRSSIPPTQDFIAVAGRNYFIKRFQRLANKVGWVNDKAVYI
ncbi:G-protein alpha subunit-domain-containing protein, partial [Mycena vulgaris]